MPATQPLDTFSRDSGHVLRHRSNGTRSVLAGLPIDNIDSNPACGDTESCAYSHCSGGARPHRRQDCFDAE
jgi:hypothetical protein